jgi:hypothetical protein
MPFPGTGEPWVDLKSLFEAGKGVIGRAALMSLY